MENGKVSKTLNCFLAKQKHCITGFRNSNLFGVTVIVDLHKLGLGVTKWAETEKILQLDR